MNSVFEVRKVLSLGQRNASSNLQILLSAYAEVRDRTVLALVCSNGYILLRTSCLRRERPVVHQLRWFHQAGKQVSALCLDPTAAWLLVTTLDGSLFIVPALIGSLGQPASSGWRSDDVTEIRFGSQRASPTAIQWWQTQDGQHMAIIGNELGEVFIVNLKLKKEIGNVYIPVAVQNLQCIHDHLNGITCLLITGPNRQQWHLLLEDRSSGFLCMSDQSDVGSLENLERKMWQLQGDRSIFIEEKRLEGRRLARYEGDALLTSQRYRGQQCVSAYTQSSGIVQLLTNKLDVQTHLGTFAVPPECQYILLTDKLVFVYDNKKETLHVLAQQTTETGKKAKELPSPLLQEFSLPGLVSALYFCSASSCLQNSSSSASEVSGLKEKLTPDTVPLPFDLSLDGCLIITKNSVLSCKTRESCIRSFLRLTQVPSDLPLAENLGVLLGLDIHSLYEVAAEVQLSQGHFAQAVRLYQLSKCPQLKRVAYFVSYGFLSELIAYIQVLFSTKAMEVALLDRVHFANMALNCFVQQVLERNQERPAVLQAFKDFLRDNQHYDDEVSIRLLQEQGLYDLLYHCAKLRGQQRLMIEHLLASPDISRDALECQTHDAIQNAGYSHILLKSQNDHYIECLTCPSLLQHLALKPQLLRCHLQHVAQLLPSLQMEPLLRVAKLYDPCHPAFHLAVRSVLTTSQCHRYFSLSSLSSISSDSLELSHAEEENVSEEDLLKFFVFVLLVLNHKRGPMLFDPSLMISPSLEGDVRRSNSGRGLFGKRLAASPVGANGTPTPFLNESLLACGASHSAYIQNGTLYTWGKGMHGRLGHGEAMQECSPPMGVDLMNLKVLAVACGAFHTMALTNYGVFVWGSSKYGQLGMGELQRTCSPLLIEALVGQQVSVIVCGQYHSLAVTSDGKAYSWGWGVHGQLGHGDPEDRRVPKRIEFFLKEHIISAAAGHCHSLILTQKGHVFAFGCGMFGQLGQQGRAAKSSMPLQVNLSEPIGMVSSGYFHCLALSKLRSVGGLQRLYVWGAHPQSLRMQAQSSRRARLQSSHHSHLQHDSSSGGLLGTPPYGTSPHLPSSLAAFGSQHQQQQQAAYLVPVLVNTSNVSGKIIKLSCGSQHSCLLTQEGEIYTWGRNTEGQLGHGTRKEQKSPSMVLSLNDCQIVQMACGFDFTLALDSTGRLFGWGQNDCGQLGQKPPDLPPQQPSPRPRLAGPTMHSASGRVITIRTNRRMITITQSCRQGELRPVQVVSIPAQLPLPSGNSAQPAGCFDLDVSSIERDITHLQRVTYYEKESPLWSLHQEQDPVPYGSRCLLLALKIFHKHYEPTSVLNHCLSFNNYQAAAELCTLEGLYAQATEYQLNALEASKASFSAADFLSHAMAILNHYIQYIDMDNYEANRQFLECASLFWTKHELSIHTLETFLLDNLKVIGYPLGVVLFCNHGKQRLMSIESLVSKLSLDFLIEVTLSVMDRVDSGQQHPELLDHVMEVSGTTSLLQQLHAAETLVNTGHGKQQLPSQALWKEIVHNFQKGLVARSSLHLSSSALDILTRSLASQVEQSQKGVDVVAFTCGHNYTMQTFQGSVLPGFREAFYRLPCSLQQTQRLLLYGYQGEELGLLPLACPPCVLTEIKGEL